MTDTAPPLAVPDDHAGGQIAGVPPRARWARRVAALVGVVVLTAAATFLATGRGDGDPRAAAPPLDLSTVSDDIAGHYRYASAHAEAFRQIPC